MKTQTQEHPLGDGYGDVASAGTQSRSPWDYVADLWRRRGLIVGVTAAVAAASVVISLLLPNWYAASVRVLPPEGGGANPLTAALLRNPKSAASALLGGVSSDYARYIAILTSRRVLDSLIEEVDLVRVCGFEDAQHPLDATRKQLSENVAFPVDEDYEFLSVVALDTDPQRAADMANFMVRQLNAINSELASQNAGNYRRFVEQRYREAQAALDSVLDATQTFQQRYGILDLDVQTRAYFDQLAALEAGATKAEVEYEALQAQLGADNAQVRALREVAQAADRKVRSVLAGREVVLPVSQGELSDVAREYVDLRREGIVQEQILEIIGPLYEQARFEEEKSVEAVQVVDAAVPPARKTKPFRALLVIVATLTGFLLVTLFTLLHAAWRRHHVRVSQRLRTALERAAPVRA